MPVEFYKEAKAKGLTLAGHELWLKPWEPPRTKTIPTRTLESVAACAGIGLTYWSDHPSTRLVWAADTEGRYHEVEIDRKTGVARHYCGKTKRFGPKGELLDTQPCAEVGRTTSWNKPTSTESLFVMLGAETVPDLDPLPEPEPANPDRDYGQPLTEDLSASEAKGPLGYCTSGRHDRCSHSKGGDFHRVGMKLQDGTRFHCPCECHRDGFTLPKLTAAEKRGMKAATEQRLAVKTAEWEKHLDEVMADAEAKARLASTPPARLLTDGASMALSLIAASTAMISTIHIDYLLEALGKTEYDQQIREELTRRGHDIATEAS